MHKLTVGSSNTGSDNAKVGLALCTYLPKLTCEGCPRYAGDLEAFAAAREVQRLEGLRIGAAQGLTGAALKMFARARVSDFLSGSCYADCVGFMPFQVRRLEGLVAAFASEYGRRPTDEEVAVSEAALLDAWRVCDLEVRLHVCGDLRTEAAVRILAAGADRWIARGGREPYTYTHFWRQVPRTAWGKIRVLASCETDAEIAEARALGYGVVVVVSRDAKPFRHNDGTRFAICPYRASVERGRPVQCVKCRLCIKAGEAGYEGPMPALPVEAE